MVPRGSVGLAIEPQRARRAKTTVAAQESLSDHRQGLSAWRQLPLHWALLLAILVVDVVWVAMGGWSVQRDALAFKCAVSAAIMAPLLFSRYRHDARLAGTLSATGFLILFTAAGGVLSYLVVGTRAPLVDETLAKWDAFIGFDWLAVYQWMQAHPSIRAVLRFAYASGLPQMLCVILFLGFTKRTQRLNEFMELFAITTLLTIAISLPFPAAGPWTHHSLSGILDTSVMSHFQPLREGSMRSINLAEVQGLISIPSLHTGLAILLAYIMWGTRLFPVFFALNALMILSTPIDGGHYLVDVIAGAALAGLLISFRSRQS